MRTADAQDLHVPPDAARVTRRRADGAARSGLSRFRANGTVALRKVGTRRRSVAGTRQLVAEVSRPRSALLYGVESLAKGRGP
jgi:hypothetical protein